MIWSLVKILFFVVAVTALTFGATKLMEIDGGAAIQLGGIELSLSPLQLAFGLLFLVIFVWLLLKLLTFAVATFKFLNGDETAISRYFDRNRERKGFEALSEGMMALASGEGHLAMTKANRAERYLNEPQLTTLLAAQAAEMVGDRRKAETAYRKLVEDDRTRFVGVRGIMKQKLSEGDTDTAMALAKRAFALKPKHEETQDVLLNLQAKNEDWQGARKTLNAKLKSGALPRDVHKRRDAVLALSSARVMSTDGGDESATDLAIEANRLSPDLTPAAVLAAESYLAKGNKKAASKLLTKAWSAAPHPEIAASFAGIESDETPTDRIKRFRALTKQNSNHTETKQLLAELYIAAEDFPSARKALGDLVDTDPTSRSMTLMAAIERGEGASDAVVRDWLAKALNAPRSEQWICDRCQNIHTKWEPVCTNCEAFDALSWRRPPVTENSNSKGADMLPHLTDKEVQTADVLDASEPIEQKESDKGRDTN